MAVTIIYVDVNSGICYDAAGAQIINENRLESYIDSHETYEFHYVTDGGAAGIPENWTPYTGFQGTSVASAFGVDDNFIHQYEAKLKGAGITAGSAVAELTAILAVEEMLIPKTGILVLRNAAGDEQTFEYSARIRGENSYTFSIVSAEAEYDFAAGDAVAVPEALMVLAEGGSTENPENYVDDSRKDDGIFTVHWWNLSDKIMSYFDFESIEEMDAIFEHAIMVNGETVKRIQQKLTLRKPLIFHRPASVPSVNNQRIASQSWVLSLLRGTMEYQFSVDGESWHTTQTESDRFYRERPANLAGEWGQAIQMIPGPKGDPGIPGPTGVDGMSSFLYVAYASDADGSNFSLTPSDLLPYRAEFVTAEEVDTPTVEDFAGKWVRFVGEKGDTGETGATGLQGPKGDKGDKGDTGETGPQGPQGERGEAFQFDATGLKSERSQYDSEAKGFAFLATDEGNVYIKNSATSGDWSDAIAFRGDKGDKGDTGEQGPQGPKGDTGDTGIQGPKGDKGDTGDTGAQGPKGDTGETGAAAVSFAVFTAVTDETAFAGTAQLINADGTAGETVDVVYDFEVPTTGE